MLGLKRMVMLAAFGLVSFASTGLAATSADIRDESLVWFTVQPLGIHAATLIAPTAQLGVLLGGDFVVGAASGEKTYSYDEPTVKSKISFSNQGVWARYFLGNSFNILLASDKRVWNGQATATQSSYVGSTKVTATAQVDVLAEARVNTIGISNLWTLGAGFTIGADWALVSSAASRSYTYTVSTNTGVDTTVLNKDMDKLGKALNDLSVASGVTVLTLGWAF